MSDLTGRKLTSVRKRQKQAFNAKKFQAKRRNILFTLCFEDIYFPKVCPVLGLKLVYTLREQGGSYPDSPSYERVDNNLGYTPNNTRIADLIRQAVDEYLKKGEQ